MRPTRCELPPLLGVALQPLRPSGLGTISSGRGPRGGGERELPFSDPPNRALTRTPVCCKSLARPARPQRGILA